jgi:hypothetical protein
MMNVIGYAPLHSVAQGGASYLKAEAIYVNSIRIAGYRWGCFPRSDQFLLGAHGYRASTCKSCRTPKHIAQKYGSVDPHRDDPHGTDPPDEVHDHDMKANAEARRESGQRLHKKETETSGGIHGKRIP